VQDRLHPVAAFLFDDLTPARAQANAARLWTFLTRRPSQDPVGGEGDAGNAGTLETESAEPISEKQLSHGGLVEVSVQESVRFTSQLREAEKQSLSTGANDCATDFSKFFSSVDLMQTFLVPEQALK
jgi:hypothetical protein